MMEKSDLDCFAAARYIGWQEVAMIKTRHIQARMSQRGIRQELVELALQYGEADGDRCILGHRELTQLIEELQLLQAKAKRALDKGGVVVVENQGRLITAYNRDSFDRRRAYAS
jgi:hypothetical protein